MSSLVAVGSRSGDLVKIFPNPLDTLANYATVCVEINQVTSRSLTVFTHTMYHSIGQQYRQTCVEAARSAEINRSILTRSGQKSAASIHRNRAARCCRALNYLRGRLSH